jgi:MFS family permease
MSCSEWDLRMKPTHARYWVVIFALTLAMIMYVQRVAISVAAVPISAELHLDNAQMGLVFGAFGLSYALFELPMGLFGDRLGVRRVLAQIVLGWSLFTALTGAAWNFASMWAIRFLFGAGEAGCFPNLTRMLSAWLPVGERIKAQALMWAFSRWGGAATPLLVLFVINIFGWRLGFVALGALGVAWCVAFLLWFKDDPARHKSVNPAELEMLEHSRKLVTHNAGLPWYRLLLRPQIFILSLQYFCFSYVWNFYISWLPKWLVQAHGQTLAAAAHYAVWPLLLGGFGSLISGLLPLGVSRRWLAFFGFAATGLLLFAITRVQDTTIAMALMALASFCSDLTMPISWNACVEIGKQYTATVAATMNMLGNFAGFVAPTLTGIILQEFSNDWNFVLYLMVAAAAVSATCWLFFDLSKAKDSPETEGVYP